MRWRRKRTHLAERLRPYVNTWPRPEPMVDADPIRMFLVRWMIETGDPIEVVAKGFGIEAQLCGDILDRRTRRMPAYRVAEIGKLLGIKPETEASR